MKNIIIILLTIISGSLQAGEWVFGEHDEEAVARVREHLLLPDRLPFDLQLDPARKPVSLIEILGVQTGMSVLDLGAIVGYSTEILSVAVGPEGRVLSHNTPLTNRWLNGDASATRRARMADSRLPNVVEYAWLIDHIPLVDVVDFAYWGNNMHDYFKGSEDKILYILEDIRIAIKPGGLLAVVDHVGDAGADNIELHRADPERVKQLIEQSGFTIEGVSDLYQDPDDDHTKSIYSVKPRGKTDRFIIIARKPAASQSIH